MPVTNGTNGFTDELLAALVRFGTKRVLIAYDNDDAGNSAAAKLAAKLLALGIECYRVVFPKGMDANEYACAVKPAMRALSLAVRQAEWLGKPQNGDAQRPTSRCIDEIIPEDVGDVPAQVARLAAEREPGAAAAQNGVGSVVESVRSEPRVIAENVAKAAPAALALESEAPLMAMEESAPHADVIASAPLFESAPATLAHESDHKAADIPPPAYRVAPSAPSLPVEITDSGELRIALGDRAYRVRGVEQNTSDQVLKVWLKVERDELFHLDTVDLAQDKQRVAWVRRVAVELGLSEDVARSDLGKVLRACEGRQSLLIRERLEKQKKPADGGAANAADSLSEEQREAGLALLRDPKLIERIVADVEATGVVGEGQSKRRRRRPTRIARNPARLKRWRSKPTPFVIAIRRDKRRLARDSI